MIPLSAGRYYRSLHVKSSLRSCRKASAKKPLFSQSWLGSSAFQHAFRGARVVARRFKAETNGAYQAESKIRSPLASPV